MAFTKRKPSPVLDNEAVRWEMALREPAGYLRWRDRRLLGEKKEGMKAGVEAMG